MFCFKFSSFLLLSFAAFSVLQSPVFAAKKSYIVYLGGHSHGPDVTSADLHRVTNSHYEFLGSFLGSVEKAKDAVIYSYKRHINGFAALLEEHEAEEITKHPNVVSVFLDKSRRLHTTHSWEFMNLDKSDGVISSNSLWKKARFGKDVIIATLDTGVWPESKSFSDKGFGPVPKRWKGHCQNETSPTGVRSNRKLIGAKYFNKGYLSNGGNLSLNYMHTPRDYEGHGTHTLSTAAGCFVPGASVYGAGNGTAKGGSPGARVAAYKVCWPSTIAGCFDSDIMEALDAAIHDGVDVISMSLGGEATDYFDDAIAIGTFHAVRNGITVVCSAGNSGPLAGTVSNVAPWIISVGASTLDREFQANVKLQNGLLIKGASISPALPKDKLYPLINSADAKASNATVQNATLCLEGTIDPKKVKGKILVCLRGINARVEKGFVAATSGAVGMILCNDKLSANDIIADTHFLPATHITYDDGVELYRYLNSSKDPQGYITESKAVLKTTPAPVMAAFSSRGPNTVTPEILKPDVIAPGVNIIAAYSEGASPTTLSFDNRRIPYNVDSGTSMACPHVSGVVGLFRSLYPHWSPAAIRSAIVTTARTIDNTGYNVKEADYTDATPFAYGSGHIWPNNAMDPGLVYDLALTDYLNFLCTSGYNRTSMNEFYGNYQCPNNIDILNFNYPSITVPHFSGPVSVIRTLKNVGKPGKYVVRVHHPKGISVSVEPEVLDFKKKGEELRFKVTLKANNKEKTKDYSFGYFIWSDGIHNVRSPIVVSTN